MWLAFTAEARALAPPPLPPDARFALALFCDPTCSDEVMTDLDVALAPIRARNGVPERAAKPLRIMGVAGVEFGIPDAAFVEAFGVGVDRPEALGQSQQVLLAWFAGPREDALTTLATAHAAFAAAAEKSKGWVEDLDTQRIYGAVAWKALEPRGKLTDWFVVDASGDPARLVTRGLRRFGDYELVVEDVAPDDVGDVSFVVNAVAEAAHARPLLGDTLRVAGGGVTGVATFAEIAPGEDDPEAPLMRLRFDGDIALVAEEAGGAAAGGDPPPIAPEAAQPPPALSEVRPADEAMSGPASLADARDEALRRFDGPVRAAFAAGLAAGEAVAVKAPFTTTSGHHEYMWVELRAWDGDTLRGVLKNEPRDVAGVHRGDEVELSRAEVFDYIWKRADGTKEGNTTARFVN